MSTILSDRLGAKYQLGPGPGDHFLAGAGVLFSAGAGDLWFFSKRFNQNFCLKTLALGDPFFSARLESPLSFFCES